MNLIIVSFLADKAERNVRYDDRDSGLVVLRYFKAISGGEVFQEEAFYIN